MYKILLIVALLGFGLWFVGATMKTPMVQWGGAFLVIGMFGTFMVRKMAAKRKG